MPTSDRLSSDAAPIIGAIRDLRATQREIANALQSLSETAVTIAGELKALRVEAETANSRRSP